MKSHSTLLKKILTIFCIAVWTLLASGAKAQDRATLIAEGEKLVKASDCFQCHRIPIKLIGPAYKDVAAKYKGADDAKVAELVGKVTKGGSGNWGTTPMRAHPTLTEMDAKKMVLWILSLADDAPDSKVFLWFDWRRFIDRM